MYVPYDPETEEQEEEEEEEEDEEVDIELEVEMESDSEDLNAITPWVPTLLAGPSNGMVIMNIFNCRNTLRCIGCVNAIWVKFSNVFV